MSRALAGRIERGASAVEYGTVVILVAAIAGGLYAVGITEKVGDNVSVAVCDLSGGTECGETGSSSDPAEDPPENGPSDPVEPKQYPADPTGETCTPLCEPVDGEVNLSEWPDPPLHPEQDLANESADEFDSVEPNGWREDLDLKRKHFGAYEIAVGGGLAGMPLASKALKHFLGESGDPMKIDINDMREDVPEFDAEVKKANEDIGLSAITDAKKRGVTGPVTYPVSTEWNAFGYNRDGTGYIYDNKNWINGMGSWQYNQTGEVTVYPPKEPGGEWTYKSTTRTNVKKYYDWDEEKTGPALTIGGLDTSFSERDLWKMHRTGMAQEFWMEGSSDADSTTGGSK